MLDNKDLYRSKEDRQLEARANSLLKKLSPRKKTRRGKKKKKSQSTEKQRAFQEAMKLHNKQKKERGQMFRDFERLIAGDN